MSPRSSTRPAPLSGGRKAQQSEQTRKSLVRTAERLFAARGYADTSIEEVVRRAGVTKGALYHHFKDKRELFEAVVARRVRGLGKSAARLSRDQVLEEGGERHGWDRVVAAARIFVEQFQDAGTRRLILDDGPSVLGRERWDEVWVENSLLGVRRLLEGFGATPGVHPSRIDAVARLLLGGIQEAAQTVAHSPDPEEARDRFLDAMLWVFKALYRQAAEDAAVSTPSS